MSLNAVVHSSQAGASVSLFMFDASNLGGPTYYFCQAGDNTEPVRFGGQLYEPADVAFTDMSTNGTGTLPTPHLKIANVDGVFQTVINTYGDPLGAVLKRVRTFRRFLDDGSSPDPTAYFGPDTFRVERKVSENPIFVEFELSAAIDQEGKYLPGRQVIASTCMWRYRIWDPSINDYDYTGVKCPYTGTLAFDANNNPTSPDKDRPSRSLTCCKLRFGANNPLPFGGFPGAGRINQ